MLHLFAAFLIISSFALRPFAYKPASKELSPQIASYFTAVWCLVFALPTLPFCWQYMFVDGRFVLFHPAIIATILKGASLYIFMAASQIVNKESTSGNAFWGFVALAIAAPITTFLFGVLLGSLKLIIIIAFGMLSIIFFTRGEGNRLSGKGKAAFAAVVGSAICNILCDTLTIKYLNWYVLFVVPYVSMLIIAIVLNHKLIPVRKFFSNKHIIMAGGVFAGSEIILIFSMQMFFSVIVVNFMLRMAQSIDLILAHHIHKEGGARLQYFFAIGTLALSYFFFFG